MVQVAEQDAAPDTIEATVLFSPSTMLAEVPIVTVFPPASICPITPKYCAVVGALSEVSVPFHSATSCVRSSPSTASARSFACK